MNEQEYEETIREVDRILSLPRTEREKVLDAVLEKAVKGRRGR